MAPHRIWAMMHAMIATALFLGQPTPAGADCTTPLTHTPQPCHPAGRSVGRAPCAPPRLNEPPRLSAAARRQARVREIARQQRGDDGALPHHPRPPPSSSSSHASPEPYRIETFVQSLDHFNFLINRTFSQRYLLNDTRFTPGGPIFVMTGAEGGDVEDTFWSYKHYFDMFLQLGGAVLFIEMRYYGKSVPFGGDLPEATRAEADRIGLLSITQSLRDYENIISAFLTSRNAWGTSPVYSFGGSLSGTLATLLRILKPGVVTGGAIVSSAPILGWEGVPGLNQYAWRERVTQTWEMLSPGCGAVVRRGFQGLLEATQQQVADAFNACERGDAGKLAGLDPRGDAEALAWSLLEAQGEFAYPLSESTISDDCARMRLAGSNLDVFAELLRLPGPCWNVTQQEDAVPDVRWGYLACTEVLHPIGCNNVTDFFPPYSWSVEGVAASCLAQFPFVRTDAEAIPQHYGLYHPEMLASYTSNVLLTYGTLDPWASMGLPDSLSPTLRVLWVANGTHCSDAEPPIPQDTAAMNATRGQQEDILRGWIQAYRMQREARS